MTIINSSEIGEPLTHWTNKEAAHKIVNEGFQVRQRNPETAQACREAGYIYKKPMGVWLSWNYGWEQWAGYEMPEWIGEKMTCLKAEIKGGLRTWKIDNFNDFITVWKDYSQQDPRMFPDRPEGKPDFWKWLQQEKNIQAIALTAKGQSTTRMRTFLYGWDCESVFVYNPEHVTFKRMPEEQVKKVRKRFRQPDITNIT